MKQPIWCPTYSREVRQITKILRKHKFHSLSFVMSKMLRAITVLQKIVREAHEKLSGQMDDCCRCWVCERPIPKRWLKKGTPK